MEGVWGGGVWLRQCSVRVCGGGRVWVTGGGSGFGGWVVGCGGSRCGEGTGCSQALKLLPLLPCTPVLRPLPSLRPPPVPRPAPVLLPLSPRATAAEHLCYCR